MTCSNNNSGAINDPCAVLAELRAAYYALLSGAQTAKVRDGDRWREFHRGNATSLRNEIAKLEYMCPKSAANPYGGTSGGSTTAGNRVLGG